MENGKKDQGVVKKWEVDPGNMLVIIYVAFICLMILFGSIRPALASVGEEQYYLQPEEVKQGELLFLTKEQGSYFAAAQLSTEVEISVSGMIARTKVRQRFQNRSDLWQEGVYVFPLPDESAVDHLRMKIGDRIIAGEIKEKLEAKKIYEKAKKDGRKASLLVQERANIFTMSVAGIGPQELIEVEIEFHQQVSYQDSVFSLRFPMVVGPRYISGQALEKESLGSLSFGATGWAMDTDKVRDASKITPLVHNPQAGKINPLKLKVDLLSGFPLTRLESLYHGIKKSKESSGHHLIELSGEVFADRDFVLEWQAKPQQSPSAALFSEKLAGADHLLLMVLPDEASESFARLARELVFVVDISGSMAGPSIVQAKEALELAIARLEPEDRFNIIVFNNTASSLFDRPRPVTAKTIDQAVRFVRGLQANGGTEMASALNLALDGENNHTRLRQVVFLTDGSVGNEQELFAMINKGLGDSRLFTVGIGSAPNSYFMSRAATIGRGSFTYIGKLTEVHDKMIRLFNKLEHPALTNITLSFGDESEPAGEMYPSPLPDLYQGEPLIAAIKVMENPGKLQLSAKRGGENWHMEIDTAVHGNRTGVAGLWARKKIRSLTDARVTGKDENELKKEIVKTALQYHLVSEYTSLVAVDKQPSRPLDKELNKTALKTNLPHGWKYGAIFAGSAQTATPAAIYLLIGMLFLFLAAWLFLQAKRLRL